MGNITLIGRLQDYAGKAMDSLYKTAGRIANPVLDRIAGMDFAGSYFGNPNIPDYQKFAALRRNRFIADESAELGRPTPPLPHGEVEVDYWKAIGLGLAAVVTLGAAGYALQKKDIGFDDVEAGISYAKHEIFGSAPAAVVAPIGNDTMVQPTATPPPDYLMYDGIKIIGDEQFQKDVVMSLEFGKKYSLPDYEFIKSNNKEIERYRYSSGTMSAADGHTSVDKNWLHEFIDSKNIRFAVGAFSHESGHNYADFNPDLKKQPNYDDETFAQSFEIKTRANLSYVNQSEIDKFYQEFNFSQFKK